VTEGPSLPPPRYAHTLHVEAPQPKPFAFLLGVALLAFAVPAGLVFAFLRVVADPPALAPAEAPAAPAPSAERPRDEAHEGTAEPPPAIPVPLAEDAAAPADAAAAIDASDAGSMLAATAVDAAPSIVPPPPALPVTFELGMGILHSCRNTAGKYLEGYQECGSAGELDRYLVKVIGQDLVACEQGAPTVPVNLRVNVDYGALAGTIEVVDAKMMPVPGPWASCLSSHFTLENLAKIRHNNPKYTLTYRVIPHLPGDAPAPSR
jgi:hypothetical protein